MKNVFAFCGVVAMSVFFMKPANALPIFVGSFKVDDGPAWQTNPPVYSGVDAAALLFGGDKDDYAISINPSMDPTTITHTAHEDFWGGSDVIEPEDFDKGSHYNDHPGFGSAYSAYVMDHADGNVNYVWQVYVDRHDQPDPKNGNNVDEGLGDDILIGGNGGCDPPGVPMTPEPGGLALLGLGGLPVAAVLRRKSA